MTGATQYYVATIAIYLGVFLIAGWGFNLQYGATGVVNLGYIASQAAGAYIAGVLSLGSAGSSTAQLYVLGANLPFPLPILAGAVAGGGIGLLMGLIALPRLRGEYFAVATLVMAVGLVTFVGEYDPLFNGQAGLSGVPAPIVNTSTPSNMDYWLLTLITAVAVLISLFIVWRIDTSPLSRALRAVRDNDAAASAVGLNPLRIRLFVMTVGGMLAGLSGGLLISATGAFAPNAWSIYEVIVVLTAVVIGGPGNNLGVAVGIFLVTTLIGQGVLFLPALDGTPIIKDNLQLVLIGLLGIWFLWFRPSGLIPERKRRTRKQREIADAVRRVPQES